MKIKISGQFTVVFNVTCKQFETKYIGNMNDRSYGVINNRINSSALYRRCNANDANSHLLHQPVATPQENVNSHPK